MNDPAPTRPAPLGTMSANAHAPTQPGALGPAVLPVPQTGTAPAAAAPGRPSVIQLTFKEKGALYAAYISAFAEGGLFVPTQRDYRLGEDIYLLLSLPEDVQKFPVAGKVAWITPANASGGRTQGVGVRFPNDEKSRVLKARIEEALGTSIQSSKPTQTL